MNPILKAFLLLSVVFWSITPFFTPRVLIEFFDGVIVAFSFAVSVVYGVGFYKSLWNRTPSTYDKVRTGIFGGWFINGCLFISRIYSRLIEYNTTLEYHYIGYGLMLLAFFASLHLIARGSAERGKFQIATQVSAEAWAYILIAALLGSAIGMLAIAFDAGMNL